MHLLLVVGGLLTLVIGCALGPAPAAASRTGVVVFSRGYATGAPAQLWRIRANGYGLRGLTAPATADDLAPAVSPDGRVIIFSRRFYDPTLGAYSDLFRVSVWGGRPRRITHCLREPECGGRLRNQESSNDPVFFAGYTAPAWSADGARLVTTLEIGDVYTVRGTLITMSPWGHARRVVGTGVEAAWSPWGRRLALLDRDTSHPECGYGSCLGLFVQRKNGTVRRQLTTLSVDVSNGISWSPNGRWIAYTDGYDLQLIRPQGGTPRLLANDALQAEWSPTGDALVYSSAGGGLFVVRSGGRVMHRLTSDPSDRDPAWAVVAASR